MGSLQTAIPGIHHVTAIASEPQQNIDFYTGILGMRLVKLTVNFDDPHTYHLYYGDRIGHPGTILTFFPWPGAPKGWRGTGQATAASFLVSEESRDFWTERFQRKGVRFEPPATRFAGDERYLTFYDYDDLKLELVFTSEHPAGDFSPPQKANVPENHAIRGFQGVSLSEEGFEKTAEMLVSTLGFRKDKEDAERFRFKSPGGTCVDLLCQPALPLGEVLVGTVHHVAWRTPDEETQKAWRQELVKAALDVTPVIDRRYFHSIYFREPGGVLFEIATDPPGFTLDEKEEELGSSLKLPTWLEPERKQIEIALPKIRQLE
jgi:glyoxalase family protein